MRDSKHADNAERRRTLLVMSSTYPRWRDDAEPGFVHELSRRLASEFEVHVSCPHAKGAARHEVMDGVHVHRYRYSPDAWEVLVNGGGIVTNLKRRRSAWLLVPLFLLAQVWAALRLIRRVRPDVVHAHWLVPQGFLATRPLLKGGQRIPVVITSHGADLFALKSWLPTLLKRAAIREADVITVVSEGMEGAITELGGDPDSVLVEPMGVDVRGRFTVEESIPRERFQLLFVGRLVEKKGLRYLLSALPAIVERFPEVTLTVVGFGPEMEECIARAKALGIEDRVLFLGAVPQSELPDIYRRAALFVAPFVVAADGDQEGLGLVTLEALACGCPAVVSTLPGTRRLIQSVDAVRGVEPGNVDALVEAVCAAIEVRPSVNQDQLTGFDWAARAEAYAGLFRTLCGSRARER